MLYDAEVARDGGFDAGWQIEGVGERCAAGLLGYQLHDLGKLVSRDVSLGLELVALADKGGAVR
jgi:hypothetical protein